VHRQGARTARASFAAGSSAPIQDTAVAMWTPTGMAGAISANVSRERRTSDVSRALVVYVVSLFQDQLGRRSLESDLSVSAVAERFSARCTAPAQVYRRPLWFPVLPPCTQPAREPSTGPFSAFSFNSALDPLLKHIRLATSRRLIQQLVISVKSRSVGLSRILPSSCPVILTCCPYWYAHREGSLEHLVRGSL
jgi:hypothetical protein